MIDSHCHLDLPEFEENRSSVIKQCAELGLTRILVPGLYFQQNLNLLSFKNQFANSDEPLSIDISFGLHPYFLYDMSHKEQVNLLNRLDALCEQYGPQIIAVGECGLDASLALDFDFQITWFELQVDLAKQYGLPLIIHHRKSHHKLIEILKRKQFSHSGVIHAFSGSEQVAHQYLDMGFKLGVGGTITYERAAKTRNTIKNIPLDSLLLETDSPDMPLCGYQGKPNSPTQLPKVVSCLAELKGLDEDVIVQATTDNYSVTFLSKTQI